MPNTQKAGGFATSTTPTSSTRISSGRRAAKSSTRPKDPVLKSLSDRDDSAGRIVGGFPVLVEDDDASDASDAPGTAKDGKGAASPEAIGPLRWPGLPLYFVGRYDALGRTGGARGGGTPRRRARGRARRARAHAARWRRGQNPYARGLSAAQTKGSARRRRRGRRMLRASRSRCGSCRSTFAAGGSRWTRGSWLPSAERARPMGRARRGGREASSCLRRRPTRLPCETSRSTRPSTTISCSRCASRFRARAAEVAARLASQRWRSIGRRQDHLPVLRPQAVQARARGAVPVQQWPNRRKRVSPPASTTTSGGS